MSELMETIKLTSELVKDLTPEQKMLTVASLFADLAEKNFKQGEKAVANAFTFASAIVSGCVATPEKVDSFVEKEKSAQA